MKDTPPYDFNAEAKALLKRIEAKPGSSVAPPLSLAAVEAALREAYRRGQGAKITSPTPPPKAAPAPAASKSAPSAKPVPPQECSHQWEEAVLDDQTLDIKCVDCGMLQREAQERCNHYFVDTGGGTEVCLACRKAKRARR